MKRCSKCGAEKERSEFYADTKHTDGLRSDCKQCTVKTVSKYYEMHKARLTNIAALRRSKDREKFRLRSKSYVNTEQRRPTVKAWAQSHREAINAKAAVEQAVKRGRLRKPLQCKWCSRQAYLVGHHEDYSKRLDVLWLCSPCHKIAHRDISLVP